MRALLPAAVDGCALRSQLAEDARVDPGPAALAAQRPAPQGDWCAVRTWIVAAAIVVAGCGGKKHHAKRAKDATTSTHVAAPPHDAAVAVGSGGSGSGSGSGGGSGSGSVA